MLLLRKSIYVGVAQGSVLGPHIFLIYRTYSLDRIESTCKIFPDDTSLFSAEGWGLWDLQLPESRS